MRKPDGMFGFLARRETKSWHLVSNWKNKRMVSFCACCKNRWNETKLKSKLFQQQLKIVQHNEIKLKYWSPCRNKWIKDLSSSEQLYPPGLCFCIYILISWSVLQAGFFGNCVEITGLFIRLMMQFLLSQLVYKILEIPFLCCCSVDCSV